MPIQSTDTMTTITYSGDSVTWLVKAGVAVVANDCVVLSHNTDILYNHGDLIGNGPYVGVRMSAGTTNSVVENASDGHISGYYGIDMLADSSAVINAGVINGHALGIGVTGAADQIENSGSIYGELDGVVCQNPNSSARLFNSGTIEGGQIGVWMSEGLSARIINSGEIKGDLNAIEAGNTYINNSGSVMGNITEAASTFGCTIKNSGLIDGAVTFGGFADLYDGRGGSVTGPVFGGDGADRLLGGTGDDLFNGGAGVDRLDGGKVGEDTFVFSAVSESTAKNPDLIARHWTALDTIDVSALDANATVSGNQDFTFGGAVAAGATLATGVIDYIQQGGNTYVVADTSGDGKADFEVVIHGTFALNAGEFVL